MPVVAGAAVLVVVIALLAGQIADRGGGPDRRLEGPLALAVTGTTDQMTQAETQTGPTVPSTPGRMQPSEDEWAELLPKLEEIAAADPGDVNAQRKLALAYYNLDRLDEAASIYEKLLAGKEDPVLRNRLGNTLRDKGDATGAHAAYRKAIAGDPTLPPPYLNLAELFWRQGEDEQALAIIEEGLAAVPEDSRATLEKGRQLLQEVAE